MPGAKVAEVGIEDVKANAATSGQRYNLMGQPAGKDFKGIVIEDGKKFPVKKTLLFFVPYITKKMMQTDTWSFADFA